MVHVRGEGGGGWSQQGARFAFQCRRAKQPERVTLSQTVWQFLSTDFLDKKNGTGIYI